MPTLNAYLTFDGNCEEAFNFYQSVFGGEFSYKGRFSEMPADDAKSVPPEHMNRIMHISLPIGGETVLMGSDTGGEWAADFLQGNNFSMSVTADSKEDADRLFAALAEGGQVTMPMTATFWGDYFGTCVDRFGINWMMSFNERPPLKNE